MNLQGVLAIFLATHLTVALAATPAIGVASARGSFRIDNAPVAGNGTIFEGTTIETNKASGELRLIDGVRMALGAETRGKVYRDRLVLERGAGQLSNASRYGVEANSLRVIPSGAEAVGRVSIRGGNRVQVAALAGGFRVVNASGLMIASVAAGRTLEFETSAGASGPSRMTGCVVKRDTHYLLTDETANVTVELRSAQIEKYAGHRVEIVGSQVPDVTPAAGATQMIQVTQWKDLGKKCSAAAAAAAAGGAAAGGAAAGGAAAGGAAAGAAAAGISTTAVVAGVAVAGAAVAGGVALTSDDSEPISQ